MHILRSSVKTHVVVQPSANHPLTVILATILAIAIWADVVLRRDPSSCTMHWPPPPAGTDRKIIYTGYLPGMEGACRAAEVSNALASSRRVFISRLLLWTQYLLLVTYELHSASISTRLLNTRGSAWSSLLVQLDHFIRDVPSGCPARSSEVMSSRLQDSHKSWQNPGHSNRTPASLGFVWLSWRVAEGR